MHELRYFQENISLSDDIDVLWLLKCRYIMQDFFHDPAGLKIYFYGKDEWIFDFLPTKREASKVLAEASLPIFQTCLINRSCRYRG